LAPIGPELERHHDAADHAHSERQREDSEPEIKYASVDRIAGLKAHAFDRREPRRKPDCEGGENNVKADDERELQARKKDRI
jgi:hypothetical protein